MSFNPFSKNVGEQLEISDLNDLIKTGVAEGYYVEYKSTFVSSQKIAHSLASFANTYGGWYFVGIDSDKESRVATNVCGFDRTEHRDPLAKILDPARQSMSHMPLLFPQLILLDDKRAVVAVHIPEGDDPPYITDDGRIYRRSGDASDPVPEKDRHTVDRLVERGRKEQERFAKFCQDDRVFSKAENTPWVNIYLQPQPRGLVEVPNLVTSEAVRSLLEKSKQPLSYGFERSGYTSFITANVPLNYGHPSGSSIILRQVGQGQFGFNTLALELFRDGAAKIRCPMRSITPELIALRNTSSKQSSLKTPEVVQCLTGLDYETLSLVNLVDFSEVVWACLTLITLYIQWLEEHGWRHELWARVAVDEVWRTVPVMDTPLWVELVTEFGPPVSFKDSVAVPDFDDYPIVLDYEDRRDFWVTIMVAALLCLGVLPEKGGPALINTVTQRMSK